MTFPITPRAINTPTPRYGSLTAGNWSMPRAPRSTKIVINNYYNQAWGNFGMPQEQDKSFWGKLADFTNGASGVLGIGSAIVGTIGDWLGLGGKGS